MLFEPEGNTNLTLGHNGMPRRSARAYNCQLMRKCHIGIDLDGKQNISAHSASTGFIPIVLHHGLFGFGNFRAGPIEMAYKIIYDAEGDNDGPVSVASSKRGKHLGIWRADHFHAVNKRLVIEVKNPTGGIAPYYLRLLDAMRDDGVEVETPAPAL